jgi:6-phosphogluconolactonase (cycloisomerase 2 family)
MRWVVTIVVLVCPSFAPLTALAQHAKLRNVVYVQTNDPAGNAILAYQRADDGELTPLPGSPFATGGTGISPTFDLGPFDSDQEIIANPARTLLFTVNGGSDSISVFHIKPNGSLVPVAGSPFPSGGSNPVSVGLAGNTLCVVNKDQNPDHPGQFLPNYASFRVSDQGRLIPIPHSSIFVDAGSSPSQALTSPDGNFLFGADFMGGLIRSFQILRNGRLIPRDAVAPPAAEFADSGKPAFPLGLAAHPNKPYVYVGFVTINRMGVYRYDNLGILRFVRSVPNSGHGICWIVVNKAGTRVYTSNTGDPSVTVYDISKSPTSPIEIQKVVLNGQGGGFQFGLDPTEKFLHVVTQKDKAADEVTANALHVFEVGPDGKLVEVPTSPTPLPVQDLVRPQGVLAL